MDYTLEEFISYCDDMQIAEESLRDINKTFEPNYEKIKSLVSNANNIDKKEDKIKLLKEANEIIDRTIVQLKSLNDDALDKALSVGSRLVSILIKIASTRDIMNKMSLFFLKEKSLTTTIPQLAISVLSHKILKSLTVRQKKKLRDSYVKDLQKYQVNILMLISKIQQSSVSTESFYDISIANEAATGLIQRLKTGLNDLVYKIRRWLQIASSWLKEKLFKLCKIEYIKIDVDYYNAVTRLINEINRVGSDPNSYMNIISSNIRVIGSTNTESVIKAVEALRDNYQSIQDDLNELKNKRNEIPSPSSTGKVVNIATKDINAIKKHFEKNLNMGRNLPGLIAKALGGIDRNADNDTEQIKRLVYSNVFSISNLMVGKSQLCISLVNDIIANNKNNEKIEPKKENVTNNENTQLQVV